MSEPGQATSESRRRSALSAAASQAQVASQATQARDELIVAAWMADCTLRQIADATDLSHMTVKRVIDKMHSSAQGDPVTIRDTWTKYEDRYSLRPGTFAAYVDVWQRVPRARQSFTGWASFSQAANAEPAQSADKVRAAEAALVIGGYKLGVPTERGARQWTRA